MFSQACVKNSVHRGILPQCMLGYTHPQQTPLGRQPPLADPPPGRHTASWQTHPSLGRTPILTATAAAGTHSSGMLFCWHFFCMKRKSPGDGSVNLKCGHPSSTNVWDDVGILNFIHPPKFHIPQTYLLGFCLQKIIYKELKITGAVRVIKGHEVLPDGSTLEQHGIIDGSTVNIVIEPDKEIRLQIKLGPKVFSHKVLNSVRVRELKQQLIDGGTVGFLLEDLTLIVSADDNDDINDDIPLDDDSLPLHLYGLSDNITLKIMGQKITIRLITNYGVRYQKSFPKRITVNILKQEIQSVDSFFGEYYPDQRKGVWLFVERGKSYKKLPDAAPIGSVLCNNDVVHFIEDRFFREGMLIPVYYNGEKMDRVGRTSDYGDSKGDTVLSVKLRLQEQLGFPVASADVKDGQGNSCRNDRRIGSISDMRVNVA